MLPASDFLNRLPYYRLRAHIDASSADSMYPECTRSAHSFMGLALTFMKLTAKQKKVLRKHNAGRTITEIAASEGKTRKAISRLLKRALNNLDELAKEQDISDKGLAELLR
jgi:DNA-directed RNA polymerase specialized sigma24 family protein